METRFKFQEQNKHVCKNRCRLSETSRKRGKGAYHWTFVALFPYPTFQLFWNLSLPRPLPLFYFDACGSGVKSRNGPQREINASSKKAALFAFSNCTVYLLILMPHQITKKYLENMKVRVFLLFFCRPLSLASGYYSLFKKPWGGWSQDDRGKKETCKILSRMRNLSVSRLTRILLYSMCTCQG